MSSALFKKNLCAVLVFFGSISLGLKISSQKKLPIHLLLLMRDYLETIVTVKLFIIQRKRNDSLAEEWIQKYISEVKKRLTNQLRQTNVMVAQNSILKMVILAIGRVKPA
jgi:hypothetical protein